MNKSELVSAIAEDLGFTKKDTSSVVDAVFQKISEALSNGEDVALAGFGTFKVKDRAERAGRNPQTGESIVIPATKAVTFKAGKALKDSVKGE